MKLKERLGRRIKELRLEKELTQEMLAEMIDIESPSYLSKIENGFSAPSYDLVERIAKAMKIQPRDLFDFDLKFSTNSKSNLDKWILKFKGLLKGKSEKEIKKAFSILQKMFRD